MLEKRLTIESLEPRALFDAVPTVSLSSKGTLSIVGTPQADTVELQLAHDNQKLGFIGTITGGNGKVTVNIREKFSAVKRIVIDTGGGKDSIFIGSGTAFTHPTVTILGGAGNDRINYSAITPILASGGSGNDVIGADAVIAVTAKKDRDAIANIFAKTNTTGVDTILGGPGNDTLSGDTNDQLDGGSGTDTANLIVAATDSGVNLARRNSLSEIYYARLGAVSVEQDLGFSLFTAST